MSENDRLFELSQLPKAKLVERYLQRQGRTAEQARRMKPADLVVALMDDYDDAAPSASVGSPTPRNAASDAGAFTA